MSDESGGVSRELFMASAEKLWDSWDSWCDAPLSPTYDPTEEENPGMVPVSSYHLGNVVRYLTGRKYRH